MPSWFYNNQGGSNEKNEVLSDISSELSDAFVQIRKADVLQNLLSESYFGDAIKKHEQSSYVFLIRDYDDARITLYAIADYIIQTREIINALLEKVDSELDSE